MIGPQKYVRNSGLRPDDFREEVEGVPTNEAVVLCVLIAFVISMIACMFVWI